MQVTQRRRLEQYGKLKGGYRRLHTPGRKPEILQLVARWLSRPGGLLFAGKVGTGFSVSNDPVGQFVSRCCKLASNLFCAKDALYDAFEVFR
jgi:hypothetical protein